MATTYSDLYGLIRAFLGDFDSSAYSYSDEVLDGQIDLQIILMDDPLVQATNKVFTRDLTAKQKAVIAIESALNIVAPEHNQFSYRGPVLSVSRQGGAKQLYFHLKEIQTKIAGGGGFAIATEGDIDILVNGSLRYFETLRNAFHNS